MKVTVKEKDYALLGLYDEVAREMGYSSTDALQYDCRKICVAKNIQDGFYNHYIKNARETNPNANITDVKISITMMLLLNGPKVDENLKANEVEIFDGFICQ